MSQKYTLTAKHPDRPQVLANVIGFLQRLPQTKSWRVEIREARKERTLDQNAALFGVAYPALVEATGYEPEELHHEFCGRYFGWLEFHLFGELRRKPRRTTTTNELGERDLIDTETMADFYEMIQRIGAEAGIDVPSPDPMRGMWAA